MDYMINFKKFLENLKLFTFFTIIFIAKKNVYKCNLDYTIYLYGDYLIVTLLLINKVTFVTFLENLQKTHKKLMKKLTFNSKCLEICLAN